MNTHFRRITCRSLACLAVIGGVASLAFAAPAGATQNQVAGVQTPGVIPPACNGPDASIATLTMTGGLIGCWYVDTFNQKNKRTDPAGGKYVFTYYGTEHFTGCLDADGDGQCSGDPTGTFYTTFTFTTQVVDTPPYAEIRGRCHHPIVSGTGDFALANGVINFKDDVSNGTSPYQGHIDY
jgi:hypothetical protein